MKSNRNKITLAFSSFLMAAVCLATSTYAWFAMANDLQIDNISIAMKATQHIEFGFYSEDSQIHNKYGSEIGEWIGNIFYIDTNKGQVTTELLRDFRQYNSKTLFSPLTAAWTAESLEGQTGTFSPQLTKMPIAADIAGRRLAGSSDNSYLQFECYLRSTNDDVYVFIQPETAIDPDVNQNTATANSGNTSLEDLNSVVNYMRFSFYTYDQYSERQFFQIYEPNPTNDYQKTSYFGRLDIDPSDGYYDFDYLSNREIVYGAYTGTPLYSEEARAVEKPLRNDGFLGISYSEVQPFSLETSLSGDFSGRQENSLTPADVKNHNEVSTSIARVNLNTPTRMVITCWSEGWDLDCSSYSASASFAMNLALSAEPVSRYDL